MAIDSLLNQTDDRWHCYLQDDNSNEATLKVVEKYQNDGRFTIGLHKTGEQDRKETTRYSVLINEVFVELDEGIACTMCDNVTYERKLVETVLDWFEWHDGYNSGYVPQVRDMYHLDGEDAGEYMGFANEYGHWLVMPPEYSLEISVPYGILDHSQVFHRLPINVKWNESRDVVLSGDADFYQRLIDKYGPIGRITRETLSYEHLLYERIHGHG
jgi:glycosyltransferase involved in cell wall biosynthesis